MPTDLPRRTARLESVNLQPWSTSTASTIRANTHLWRWPTCTKARDTEQTTRPEVEVGCSRVSSPLDGRIPTTATEPSGHAPQESLALNEWWFQPALSVSEPRLPGQGGGGGLVRSRVAGSQLVSTTRWDRSGCTRTTSMRRTASRRRLSIGSARRTCWIAIAAGSGPWTLSEISLSPSTKNSTERSRSGPGIFRAARCSAYRSEPDGGQPDRTRTITLYRAIFDHASGRSPRSSAGGVKAR